MNYCNFSLSIILVFLIKNGYSTLFCPVTWTSYTSGDKLPADIFMSLDNKQAFGRGFAKEGDTNHRLGIVNLQEMVLQIPVPVVIVLAEFEIMTNPEGCTIEWGYAWETDSSYLISDSFGTSLGRSEGEGKSFFGCVSGFRLHYFDGGNVRTTTRMNYLSSYSDGITLTLQSFDYDKTPATDSPSTTGLDEIYNNADTTVTQRITHSKSISETMSISMYDTNTWYVAVEVHAKMDLPGGLGPSAKHTEKYSESNTYRETISITRAQTISTSRTITVPPHNSVHVCSVVGFAENFQSDFTALAEYRVKGWTGDEVRDYLILENEDFHNLEVFGNAAFRFVQGNFTGSIALTNKIVIVPSDSHYGCEKIII